MIHFVSGILVEKKPTQAVIDVSGIGYLVLIPTSTFERLPGTGEPVLLHTHHHVREDAVQLFGFALEDERSVFQQMLAVSGVGPKLALATLSAMSPNELCERIVAGDVDLLTRIPGVGRKTAERLVVELRDRFARLDLPANGSGKGGSAKSMRGDALSALEALGLSRSAAEKSVRGVLAAHPDIDTAEDLIKLALRER